MAANTLVSDINEILVGYYLNNKKWYDDGAKAKYHSRVKEVTPADLNRATEHAKVMASEFLKYAKAKKYGGKVIGVYWTARAGSMSRLVGVEVDQTKNTTDTLIRFNSGPSNGWLGLSAKSTKGRGDIGFKNPGVGVIDKLLGTKIVANYKKKLDPIVKKYNWPETDTARKMYIRRYPSIKTLAEEHGTKMLHEMRNTLYIRLNKMKPKELYSHCMKEWLNADKMFPPYVKITGMGDKPPYSATLQDPTKNEKNDAMATLKFKLEKVGNESIGIIANNKKVFKMRFKFESEKLASSLKMSGESW